MSGALEPTLAEAVEARLAEAGRERGTSRPIAFRPAGGGCIHRSGVVELAGGGTVFLKANSELPDDVFEREAEGLRALAESGCLRVPRDPLPGVAADGTRFLVMEAIELTGSPGGDRRGFFEDFGRRFARLHRETPGERYGFAHDNYLGPTPQPNPRYDDWGSFFRDHRLGHQLRLARETGASDAELERLGERLLDRVPELVATADEPPVLLHGDLWSGNFGVAADGEPVVFDPAAYYGQREADLAMTRLFGGFDPRFYAAYEEEWPLPPGSEDRLALYELYHLLNHLNIFGGGYRSGCLAILRRFG